MRDNRTVAGVAVAALGLSLAYGAAEAAGTDAASTAGQAAPALSKAETKAVKKIATKIARKEIKRAAPTLRVGSAARADRAGLADLATNATNAQNAVNAVNAQKAQSAVHATSADMATNAQNAVNAAKVGGLDVKKTNAVIAPDAASVKLVDTAGFTLTASCAAGAVDLVAASSVPGGRLRTFAVDNNETVATQGSSNLSATGFSVLVPGGADLGSVTAEFVAASGEVVNVWLGYRNDAPGCAYFGNYMVG